MEGSNKSIKVSIVSPVYYGEKTISALVEKVKAELVSLHNNFEIILVDDNSPDDSWNIIKELCRKDNKVKGVRLSRNFGQHAAIYAGLSYSSGEWTIVMDCDLQDKPEELVNLYSKAQKGFDIVFAKRNNRTDGFFKKQFSRYFYLTLEYLTDTKQDPDIANFGIYNRKVIDSILRMNDYVKYFPSMVKWVGFNTTDLIVQHGSRFEGKTSYSFKRLFSLGLNVILSFSDKPLKLTVKAGMFISFATVLIAIFYFIRYLLGEITVAGYSSLIISIWFLSGFIISSIGMLGLYIGKIFDQVKGRPIYIVSDKQNVEN